MAPKIIPSRPFYQSDDVGTRAPDSAQPQVQQIPTPGLITFGKRTSAPGVSGLDQAMSDHADLIHPVG